MTSKLMPNVTLACMIKTREVTSVPAFPDSLEGGGQKQVIQGNAYFTAPQHKGAPAKDIFLCHIKGKVARWQAHWVLKG